MIRKILVGADGSPAGAAAVRWATDLAAAVGAAVVVVHAAGLRERAASGAVDEAGFETGLAAVVERDWCEALRRAGVAHEVVVRPGPPVAILLEVATERGDADLLVVGRRGAGAPDAPQLGSTSQQLVAEADLPVVVVAGASDTVRS